MDVRSCERVLCRTFARGQVWTAIHAAYRTCNTRKYPGTSIGSTGVPTYVNCASVAPLLVRVKAGRSGVVQPQLARQTHRR